MFKVLKNGKRKENKKLGACWNLSGLEMYSVHVTSGWHMIGFERYIWWSMVSSWLDLGGLK